MKIVRLKSGLVLVLMWKICRNISGWVSCFVFPFSGVPTVKSPLILDSIVLTQVSKFWTAEISFGGSRPVYIGASMIICTKVRIKLPVMWRLGPCIFWPKSNFGLILKLVPLLLWYLNDSELTRFFKVDILYTHKIIRINNIQKRLFHLANRITSSIL